MATTSRFVAKNGLDNNNNSLKNIGTSGSDLSFSGGHSVTFTSTGTTTLTLPTTGTLATTTDIKDGTLTLGVSGSGLSGSASFSANTTSSVTFTVTSNATSSNSSSTIVFRDSSGNFSAGTITANLSGNATNVTGIVLVANGGTGTSDVSQARINLGASTTGSNLFTLTNPGATTFIRINANNTISALGSSDFRTAIGAGTGDGTVTNVSLSLPNIFTLTTSSVSTSGTLTATLTSQNANYVFAGPTTGSATTPAFRALVADDIPALDYAPQTTGTSILYGDGSGGFSNVTIGTGLSFTGGTLSNSSPDQTVSLSTGNANITITGTYPNFTISATDTNTTYTNGTGLNLVGTTFSINTSTVVTISDSQTLNNKTIGTSGVIFAGTASGTSLLLASATPSSNTLTLPTTTGTLAITSDVKDGTLTLAVSGVGLSGSASFSANTSSNATFTVTSNATSANTVSAIVSRDASGNFSAGTITANLSGNATNVSGIVAIANGGTNASTATAALTNLGATTIGANIFKLTNPGATTFIRINSANTVSTRTAEEFRSDLGATTVGSALFTLSNPGSTSFIRINADNTVTAQSASNYRSDLGANTVGSNIFTLTNPSATTFIRINADNTVTTRSASEMRTDLGATSLGSDFFTLSTSSTSYIQITAAGTISLLNAANFRTAIGAGSGNGTVTSVGLTVPSILNVSNSPITTSGDISISLASQSPNKVFAGPSTGTSSAAPTFRSLVSADFDDTLTVPKGGTGASSLTSNAVLVGNGTSAVTLKATSSQYRVFVTDTGGEPVWGSLNLSQTNAIAGTLPIPSGGTNATTASAALTNLGGLSNSTSSTQDGYFGNIYLQDDTSPSHYLQITNFDNLSANRVLKLNCNDGDRSLTISSDSTISGTNTGDQTITLTGDVTGSGSGSFSATLSASGVTAGTYNNSTTAITPFTVDNKGRITSTGTASTISPAFSSITSKPTTLSGYGIIDALSNSTSSTQAGYFGQINLYDTTNPSNYLQILNIADLSTTRTLSINTGDSNRTLTISGDSTISGTNTGDQTITLTGDVTGSGTSSFAATLSNSGVTAGTYNNSTTAITPFTVDNKGRITSTGAASTISPAFSSITSTPTTLSGYGITDALSNSSTSTQNGYFGDIFLYDDSTPSNYLQITNSANLTADRILSINVNNSNRTISLSGNLTVSSAATISGTNTGDQTISITGSEITATGTSSALSASIITNAIAFSKLVQSSSGNSVIGRSANTSGNFAEISTSTSGHVLRLSGSTLEFGTIDLSTSNTVGTSILSVANGGTGASSFTTSTLLVSNSSSTTGAVTTATALAYSSTSPHLTITAQGASTTPVRIVGAASQSANLFEVYSTSGSALLTVGTTSMNLQPYGTSAGNTYGIKFLELSANGSNGVTLKAPDSISSDYSVTVQPNTKSITILSPTSSDKVTLFYSDTIIKITKVVSVIRGTSATSSWQLYHGTNRTSGTSVFSTTQSTTSTTTGDVLTSFSSSTTAANSFIWLELSTQTSVTELHITLFYD